ncbi:exodeoxyribonuclease VII small subunit [Caminicella sporogenes]|uniref:exodeoxyribonuclease VII small subunit n=1 Tax=Caminicella sporogenes TaxID=166485 RepID=UPI002541826C|nr:exodeoxyribonuclease VII small subunit [Caminicella sporogenes]WIF94542.1 exodeoxyribonuclease VII small subunit [Caminicella sporogenes]
MTDNTQNKSFETDLNRLKDIVKLLEEGNLSLEDSLKYFEEGIKIYRRCINVLNSAQQRISLLLHDEDGEIKTQPFDVYEEE